MLFWIYWIICISALVLSLRSFFHAKEWKHELSAALVMLPLVLRVLFLK
ncbi:hypothetical protein IT157_04175 [bacterium]|nr:hypothetical protein [bacterium]